MPALVVGVLNVTPDSFSDGGRFARVDEAVDAGVAMVEAGAHWIDVGGESTRPGATVVSEEDECSRVVPVIEALAARLGSRARISVDTYKSGTARAAIAAGASVVNDVSGGLLDPAILSVAAGAQGRGIAVVLGHLRGTPATMMNDVHYDDVVSEVAAELGRRVAAARAAGCREVWADPGIGFGKVGADNLALLRGIQELRERLGVPIMVGVSRKRFIGELTGRAPAERDFGTAAAAALAVMGGAAAIRVHNVAAGRDVALVAEAIAGAPARHS
jgi:dihydropteroate synthase